LKLYPIDPKITIYEEGFGPQDPLNRRATGERISALVERVEDPIVLALDGAWGTGKTHFLKRWVGAHSLENKGTALTIYFDAFANDFLDDPLIAITSAIDARLPKSEKRVTWKNAKTAAFKLAQPLTRIGLAIGSGLGSEIVGTVGDQILKATEDEVEKAAERFWKREDGRRHAMQQLKSSLVELTADIEDKKGQTLVIVIDELDRCRPDYALGLLETIKHFFSVPKVHFVLGVNLRALQDSVRARYGAMDNAHEYLRRFINLTVKLPENDASHSGNTVQTLYFQHCYAEMGLPETLFELVSFHLKMRLRVKSESLRDIGRLLSLIALLPVESQRRLYPGSRQILISLILFKAFDENQYQQAARGKITLNQVIDFYGIQPEHTDETQRGQMYHHPSYVIKGYWEFLFSAPDHQSAKQRELAQQFGAFSLDDERKSIWMNLARDYVDTFSLVGPQP
jgi:KAP family P-loop domain